MATVHVAPVLTSSLLGVNLSQYDVAPGRFAAGTQVMTTQGGLFQYCNVLSAISTYNAVIIDDSGNASNLTTTNATAATGIGKMVGVAQTSIAVSCFGWIQRQGKLVVNVAAQCQDFVPLFTTATPGVVDDVTVSECLILGLNIYTSASNATAATGWAAGPLQMFPFANPA
tara:strand:- start:4586 stop:5098 length:513 start_codon:yes stop_codon:yes gene_type:complete